MSVKINLEYGEFFANLYALLGIDKSNAFDNWEKSQLVIKYTSFGNFEDLQTALKNAQCNFDMNLRYYITNFSNGSYDYVLWIERNGIITATYDIEDNMALVEKLFEKIETANNKKCFFGSKKERNQYLKYSILHE